MLIYVSSNLCLPLMQLFSLQTRLWDESQGWDWLQDSPSWAAHTWQQGQSGRPTLVQEEFPIEVTGLSHGGTELLHEHAPWVPGVEPSSTKMRTTPAYQNETLSHVRPTLFLTKTISLVQEKYIFLSLIWLDLYTVYFNERNVCLLCVMHFLPNHGRKVRNAEMFFLEIMIHSKRIICQHVA